jgi:hypothetical protein
MSSPYRTEGLWRYALLGVAALLLFGWLFQRYSLAPRLGVTLNRAQAVARAQAIAAELGWQVEGWEVRAWSVETSDELFAYYRQNPAPEITQNFTLARFNVHFRPPNAPGVLEMRLNAQGQLLRFHSPQASANETDRRGGPGGPGGPPPPPGRAPAPAKAAEATTANAQLAEQVERRYFASLNFSGAPTVTSTRNGFDFTWKKDLPHDARVRLEADAEIAEDRVQHLELALRFTPAYQTEFDRANKTTAALALPVIAIILFLLLCLAVAIVFFASLSRNEIQQRLGWRLFLGTIVVLLAINLLSGYTEVMELGNAPNPHVAFFLRLLGLTILTTLLALLAAMAWAAGQALAARRAGRRTVAFELLLSGRFTHSYVARQFFIGLCASAFFALTPYLLKATLFRAAPMGLPEDFEIFSARLPGLIVFSELIVYLLFIVCAFGLPFIEHYVPRRAVAAWLIVALGSNAFVEWGHFPTSYLAEIVTALLTMALLYWLYRHHDLLATMVAASAGHALLHCAALWSQPVTSLRTNAWAVVGGMAIAALVAFIFVKRGTALDEKLFEPLHVADTAIERERLKAEIAVAQRAQQQMLPAAPPEIPGLEIAASCQPSKDVGGDLFDFLKLPNGQWGIVVADVSGKGVPAALYMTLTKGVLASVTEYESDPGAILRETNRHLYEACRKKVFVTLFLGVYDPATRQLTYARAGHNPTVYHSPSTDQTELLKPRGMGLGLAGEKMFNPTLAVASLPLHTDDLLIFYSDGITEAMNKHQEEYGEERLTTVARVAHASAQIAHDAILTDVKNFLGNVAPQDDQTLIVLRLNAT